MAIGNPLHGFGSKAKQSASPLIKLDEEMIRSVRAQNAGWSVEKLAQCTMRREKSHYMDCKSEVEIFSPTGELIMRGREFSNGPPGFWPAS